ncbi:hypothetical protein K449DRAFT_439469 [Hypoxylon sp. EC38]|nr:hypothetical protein K449DRAFT_439469 [Hypoxylon sp. EC38]
MASEADPETGNGIDTNANDNAASSPDVNVDTGLDAGGNSEAHEADVNAQANTASDDAEPESRPHNTGGADAEQTNVEPETAQPGDDLSDNPAPESDTASPNNPPGEELLALEPEPGPTIEPDNIPPVNPVPVNSAHQNPAPVTATPTATTPPPPATSVRPPPTPTPTLNPDLDKRFPLTYWLLCGGIGPPPKMRNFLRMTQERNAVSRAREVRAAARKQALEERREYLENWEKEWGPIGATGLVIGLLGGNRRRRG